MSAANKPDTRQSYSARPGPGRYCFRLQIDDPGQTHACITVKVMEGQGQSLRSRSRLNVWHKVSASVVKNGACLAFPFLLPFMHVHLLQSMTLFFLSNFTVFFLPILFFLIPINAERNC